MLSRTCSLVNEARSILKLVGKGPVVLQCLNTKNSITWYDKSDNSWKLICIHHSKVCIKFVKLYVK